MQNRQKDGSWNDAQIPTMAGNTEPSFAQDNPRPACTRTVSVQQSHSSLTQLRHN